MINFADVCVLAEMAVTDPFPEALESWVTPYCFPYYAFMRLLTRMMKGCFCVELGVEQARGCIALASGSKDARVLGLDNHRYETWSEVSKAFPNVRLENLPSLPAKVDLLDAPIDILHIDTEHSYAMAGEEYRAYEPYLADTAVVLFDDLHAQEDAVLSFFTTLNHKKVQMDELHPTCGYGFVYYDRTKSE